MNFWSSPSPTASSGTLGGGMGNSYSRTDNITNDDGEALIDEAEQRIEVMTDRVGRLTLPLQKGISSCVTKCFDSIRGGGDPWLMTDTESSEVEQCIESCEAPMREINEAVEMEHGMLMDNLITCVNRCTELDTGGVGDNDDIVMACAARCIGIHLSQDKLDDVVEKIGHKIQSLRDWS